MSSCSTSSWALAWTQWSAAWIRSPRCRCRSKFGTKLLEWVCQLSQHTLLTLQQQEQLLGEAELVQQ